jgi:signal transduction histidine kinase
MIEQAADELRQIMCELRPAALEDHDLAEMLEGYVHQFRLTCRTRVEFSASGHAPHVGPEARVAVLRIVQEALSNARRHAHANLIAVALEPDDDRICCSIADDGIGFASERPVRPSGQHHWGLASMSDRAALVGGEIEVRSAPGEGTRVTVRIPLPGS